MDANSQIKEEEVEVERAMSHILDVEVATLNSVVVGMWRSLCLFC